MERIEKTILEQQVKPVIDLAEMFGADKNITEKAKERAWEMTKKDMGWSDSQGDIMHDAVTNVKQLVTFHKPNILRKKEPHTSISVHVKEVSQNEAGKTLQEYFEEDINETKQITPNYKVIEGPEEITLNGNKMLKFVSENSLMGYSSKDLSYMCLKNNILYTLTASAVPASDFEEYYEYFQESINSLKIN